MDWQRITLIALTVGAVWQGAHQWRLRPVHPPDGVLAPDDPGQVDLHRTASITYGAELARLRVGQVVHLTGLLVDGVRADGMYFSTSLTRSDTGAGACEVMFVQSVAVRE